MAISKRFIFAGFFLLISFSGLSQVNRYMVFFKDKTGTSFNINQPLQFLSQKAIDRRIKKGALITSMDLPVNSNYVQGVRDAGAEVFFTTRWANGVLIQCDAALIESIAALPFVDHVEFVAPQPRLLSSGRRNTTMRKKNGAVGIETQTQLQMIGIPEMQQDDFRGEGITIAVFDGGFQGVNVTTPFQDLISEGRIDNTASYDFVQNSGNVFQYDDHGTEVLSIITAYIPDAFTGGAYKANFQLYVTEDVLTEYRIEEYNWLFAAERADSAGVDIINSSLGYYDFDLPSMNYNTAQMDGKTTVVTKAAQWVADRGVLVVCSAGNEGNISSWRIITAPADAEDVIAVANVNAQGIVSSSSSIGPSADGRIKPDVAALGSGVRVVRSNGAITGASGTSLSAPLITSLVAGVWQRFPDLSNTELMNALKMSASQAKNPDNSIGYGIPHYTAIVNYMERSQQANIFEVYPNPITDTVTVRPLDPDSISNCRIELISSQGQLIAETDVAFTWKDDLYKTDLSALPTGLYYLRVWLGKQRFVFKVVKQ